jgi:hypothetical protein
MQITSGIFTPPGQKVNLHTLALESSRVCAKENNGQNSMADASNGQPGWGWVVVLALLSAG